MKPAFLAALATLLPGVTLAAPIREEGAARRGLAVYHQVCSVCHSLSHVEIGDLAGLGLSDKQLRDLAADIQVSGPPGPDGTPTTRAANLSDRLLSHFPDEASARAANNGALPPDLSEIARTRQGGAHRIFTLLTGYTDPPKGVSVPDGQFYNAATHTHLIAMPPPLADGAVTYDDGTNPTLAQEAHDAAAFLAWSADPHRSARHWLGGVTIAFLAVLAGLVFALKRRVWSRV